jgi:hypothetical protein
MKSFAFKQQPHLPKHKATALQRLILFIDRRCAWLIALGLMLLIPLALALPPTLDDAFHALLFAHALPCDTHHASQGFLLEQFVFLDGDAARTLCLTQSTGMPWWIHEQLQIAFFRPLTSVTHWIDLQLWYNSSWLPHLHSLLLYLLAIWLFHRFHRELSGNAAWVALATLLFTVDLGHLTAVTWIANRSALIALIFLLTSLLCLERFNSRARTQWLILSCLMWTGALFSAEMGLGGLAYLGAYCLILGRQSLWQRIGLTGLYLAIGLGWFLGYKMMGFGATQSAYYTDPSAGLGNFAGLLAARAPYSYFLAWSGLPTSVFHNNSYILPATAIAISLLFLCLLAIVLWQRFRHDRQIWFWLLGSLGSLLPIGAAFPHERNLVIVSLGVIALLARLTVTVFAAPSQNHPTGRFDLLVKPMVFLLVVIHLFIHPLVIGLSGLSTALQQSRPDSRYRESSALVESALSQNRIPVLIHATTAVQLPTLVLNAYWQSPDIAGTAYMLSAAQPSLEVTRTGSHELEIRTVNGLLPTLAGARYNLIFGPNTYQPALMERDYQDMRFEVLSVAENGYPQHFRVHLKQELTRYQWLISQSGRLEVVALPEIGQTVHFPKTEK